MFNSLDQVDWDLLHQQKLALLGILGGLEPGSPAARALQGLVHLLDALQDDAAAAGRWTFPGEVVLHPAEPAATEPWSTTPPIKRYYIEDADGRHHGPVDDYDEAAGLADRIHGRIIVQEADRPPASPDAD